MQPIDPRYPDALPEHANFYFTQQDLSSRVQKAVVSNGKAPIEQWVEEAPPELQNAVFERLIAEEVRLRKSAGDAPTLTQYLQRFTDRTEQIEKVWRSLQLDELFSTADREADSRETPGTIRSSNDTEAFAEPIQLGPYRILSDIGAGTFGSVYKAQHESTGKVVAVKMLKAKWARDPECGESMRKQFAEEARMMLQFDHSRVVRVISLDDRADPPYFVQEYIEGETLAKRLEGERLTIAETMQYAIQIADGLAHIHRRERWHRDLKPSNILVDRNNQVFIADFGLALDDAQRWSFSRGPAGTYPYMAPEQINGATHRLNARCDIWAFGVILYEMLTGRRPFRGNSREQLCDEIIERTPAAPRELVESIPRELNRLCMQCLSKRDAERPHAAADLRDDLALIFERLGEGSSTATSPTTPSIVGEDADAIQPTVRMEYPIPTLKRFTAEQAELYLRLMPRSYATEDELPELIAYWKQRILERDPDKTFAVGIMVGVSGCGKSSMLEAGLVPALPESILPILVEASESDTEERLLNKLRRAIPNADTEKKWSLVEWAFRIRSSNLLPPDTKVVFILDQFEQWLNAHGGEPTNPLLDAMHQCDGEHLQAIVCVREGFHATLMRFVQALRFKLDEERNYATAHRFTPSHARYVLSQFGRGLKRLDDPITEEQQAFIDAAVEGLAESDRGVVCVRLVVLVLVMQDRPWTVEELNSLGGLDGIGSQFLIDCFEGRTASEQYRRYLPAAMRVLAELLPAEGLEIKDVRSHDQLLAASELDELQFDDLMNILTRKLFLITLVETDSGTVASGTSHRLLATGNFFQLTHDFLVSSIREWLALKERETKAGRARLKLRERSSSWRSKRETKQLPTLFETIVIRWRTDFKKWKPEQRELMRAAVRHHLTIWGTTVVLLLSSVGALQLWAKANRRAMVRVATETLQNNLGKSVAVNIRELRKHPRALVLTDLKSRLSEAEDPSQKLALAFAFSDYDDSYVSYLITRIDEELTPDDQANMLAALQRHSQSATKALLSSANDATAKLQWRRKAKLAIVALALDYDKIAVDMSEYVKRPDATQRSIFIEEIPNWEIDYSRLAALVAKSPSSGLRSALCLAIGSLPEDELNAIAKENWISLAKHWFREMDDSSTHSASGWLLNYWHLPVPKIEKNVIGDDRHWFVNSVGMTFVRIPKQTGMYGDSSLITGSLKVPLDLYFLSSLNMQLLSSQIVDDYWILDREVAQRLFSIFLADSTYSKDGKPDNWHGFLNKSPNLPVHNVTWNDAALFCNWLSYREGRMPSYRRQPQSQENTEHHNSNTWEFVANSNGYRLPILYELLFATRAGTTTVFPSGDDGHLALPYCQTFPATACAPVGWMLPNSWGLHDCIGNVSEWVTDGIVTDGIMYETRRVENWHFGGSWSSKLTPLYATWKPTTDSLYRSDSIGFRVVLNSQDAFQLNNAIDPEAEQLGNN